MHVYLFEDIGGFGGPDEWFRVVVVPVPVDVLGDRHDQLSDIAEDPAAESILREIAEEPLDHVEPRATGRVKYMWTLWCRASHFCTLGCLCVA